MPPGRVQNFLDTIFWLTCVLLLFPLIFKLLTLSTCLCPTTSRDMWWLLLENEWIIALYLRWYHAKQKYSFLHRSRSIVMWLQQWNCSRGEHKSSVYIFNEPQLKVVSWRVRVNVLFSDLYTSDGCCRSRPHFTAPRRSRSLKKAQKGLIYFLKLTDSSDFLLC